MATDARALEFLADLVGALSEADSIPDATGAVSRYAVDHLGADLAFVSIRDEDGRLVRPDFDSGAERLGYLDSGPMTLGLAHHATLTIDEVETDRAWPEWSSRASVDGIGSLRRIGMARMGAWTPSLDLLARRPHAFGASDEGLWAADHTSLALHLLERISNLGEALESRAVIAQAQGLLMERHGLSSGRAMSYLRRRSQDEHVKVRQLAADLVSEWERGIDGQGAPREEHPPRDQA